MSERIFIKLPLSAFKNLPEESSTDGDNNVADMAESSTPPKRRRGRPAGKRNSPLTPLSISLPSKREAAVAAREKLTNSNKKTKETKSRRAKPRNTSRSPGGSKNSSKPSDERSQRCFICDAVLSGDIHEITQHIDQCLSTNEPYSDSQDANTPSPVSSTQFVEYEWAGQSRVRATSLLEAGFTGTGFVPCKKEQDVDDDLDIDQVEAEMYGQSQFSDRDILILKDQNDDEDLQYENDTSPVGISNQKQQATPMCVADVSDVDSGTNDNAAKLLIESLKAQVQEQKALSEAVQRCVICLDPYRSPLVSVSCWHVHCEKCWLHTLGAKKLCPQCQCITQPTDLRRIYL